MRLCCCSNTQRLLNTRKTIVTHTLCDEFPIIGNTVYTPIQNIYSNNNNMYYWRVTAKRYGTKNNSTSQTDSGRQTECNARRPAGYIQYRPRRRAVSLSSFHRDTRAPPSPTWGRSVRLERLVHFFSLFVRARYSFNRRHVVPTRFFPFQNTFAFRSRRPIVVIDVQNNVTLHSCLTYTRVYTAKNSYKMISRCHKKNVKSKIINFCNGSTVIKGTLYRFYTDSYKKQYNIIGVFINR